MKKIKKTKRRSLEERERALDLETMKLMEGVQETYNKAVKAEEDAIFLLLRQGISMSDAREMIRVSSEVKESSLKIAERAAQMQQERAEMTQKILDFENSLLTSQRLSNSNLASET